MKREDKLFPILLWALGLPLTLWLAMVFAQPLPCAQTVLTGRLEVLSNALEEPFSLQWTQDSPRMLMLFGLLYVAAAVAVESSRPNLRPGVEHGSSSWGNPRALNAQFAQSGSDNLILTQNVKLGLDSRKHRRNLNVLIIGGSGAGKTRFYAKPNLMQCNTSFVVTDPNGKEVLGYILQAVH